MSLYTKKGDSGKTTIFGCDQRISKSSAVAEALGTLDEINSFLGVCKVLAHQAKVECGKLKVEEVINSVQQNLFIVQAELAGADKIITKEKVEEVEKIIDDIEKELPPIKTFFISGGTSLSANLDFARTLARRAERRVVGVYEEGEAKIGEYTISYLNRLSSLLYALARLSNHKSAITEESPTYK
ncbi:MAG: ATP/cobalamin adenosyltransferase [Parcubacteria group bacterium LiPW_30]|nr:MAG: ATP/cobalamin adenosyltransferase [Parcubacteria group bacterium LiPW_30]